MWSSRLFWKLFLVYAGLHLLLDLGFLYVINSSVEDQVLSEVEARLQSSAVVARHLVGRMLDDPAAALEAVVASMGKEIDTRLTVIDADGRVLADSDESPAEMENHANRPEIREAAEKKRGISRRTSTTLGISMMYVALPIEREGRLRGFVRMATAVDQVDAEVNAINRKMIVFAAAVALLALGLTYAVVRRIIQPLDQLTVAARRIAAGEFGHPVVVESRDELGMLAAAFNTMQRELAKRLTQLRENGQRLATVLGGMVEGVLAVDAKQRILLANEASRSLLALVTPDVVGRPLLEVTRSPAVHEAVVEAFRTPKPQVSEFDVPGNTRRILSLRATRLPGEPCPGVVVVLHDVTELRRLENLRREFVANVSHELKTPLASIKAYSETLRLGAIHDPENNLVFLGRIEEQAERLHQLILDMIQLARVESGQEAFEITSVPVAEVVQATVAAYADAAQAKRIQLRAVPPPGPVHVRADEEGVRTILDNLVDNAIKYTPEGGNVTVRWRLDTPTAVLEVEDTGIGINPEDQARVFERFYRVDRARSRELGGTGLGLSIVKHLSQAFGGSVGLTSRVGAGSTFQIRLPLA